MPSLAMGVAAFTLAAAAAPETKEARHARAFTQAACGGCHGVERYGLCANPKTPELPTIVNRPGLTADTLRTYLLNAHNYPEETDFYLDADEVEELVSYMMTLQVPLAAKLILPTLERASN